MDERGSWQTLDDGVRAFATVHASWLLRQSPEARAEAFDGLVRDPRLFKVALGDNVS